MRVEDLALLATELRGVNGHLPRELCGVFLPQTQVFKDLSNYVPLVNEAKKPTRRPWRERIGTVPDV